MKSYDELRFDVRLIEKNIKSGVITPKELEQHLDSLPDVFENSETLGEDEKPSSEEDSGNSSESGESDEQ